MLLEENLLWLYWKYGAHYPALGQINGFPNNSDYDAAIQFWMDFWKLQGLSIPEYDPLLIKALIAVESSFNPVARSKVRGSSAFGLMQVTDQTRRILSGIPNKDGRREMRPPYIQISSEEAADPVVNIAAGTRWLFHKNALLPKRAERTMRNVIKNYHSWNEDGEAYAERVYALYKKSR